MPYLSVNGIRLRYELWGEGETPLILLHGLGSSADDWLLQLPAFGPYFKCVPLDLRGHGASDKPAGRYSIALFAADVAQLMQQLALAPAHILGLSLGGMVAQQLALDHPTLVRSLVLINTLPGLWPPSRSMWHLFLRRRDLLWQPKDMARAAARIADDLFPGLSRALLHEIAVKRLAANDPRAYRQATWAVLRYRPGRRLARLRVPTLIIAGENDRVVPRVYQERLRALLPHATFVSVPNSGHASNLDQPEVVNAAVLNFLLALEARGEP